MAESVNRFDHDYPVVGFKSGFPAYHAAGHLVIDHHLFRKVVPLDETGQITGNFVKLGAGRMPVRRTRTLTWIHGPFRVQGDADIWLFEPLLERLRLGDELRSAWLKIEQHHGPMLASSLVVRGNLRIGQAYAVLAATARAALDDGRDHLDDRQDLPPTRVRFGFALDLSDPLVQRPCPEPAESCSSGHAGIADKA